MVRTVSGVYKALRDKDKALIVAILEACGETEYAQVNAIAERAKLSKSNVQGMLKRFPHLFEWKLQKVTFMRGGYERAYDVMAYRRKPKALETIKAA